MEGLQPPEVDPRAVLDEICAIVVFWKCFHCAVEFVACFAQSLVPIQSTGR